MEEQQPNVTYPFQEPPKSKKLYWLIIPIIILIIVAITVGFFTARKLTNRSADQNTATTTDQFAGWKTYRNESYGFEFKYPRPYLLEEKNGSWFTVDLYDSEIQSGLTLSINHPGVGFEHRDVASSSKFFIDDVMVSKEVLVDIDDKNDILTIYSFHNDDYGFMVVTDEIDSQLNEVMSTFRFIKPDASVWKTFKNIQFGFEFQYPINYVASIDSWSLPSGETSLLNAIDKNTNAQIQVILGNTPFNPFYLRRFAPTGLQDFDPVKKTIGEKTFYYYGLGGGGVNYPDQYFYNLNGTELILIFDGPYEEGNQPSEAVKETYKKILSTFKFTK